MTVDSEGEILFDHLERFLGSMKFRWHGKSVHEKPFEVFVYSEQPEPDCQSLVTFGLSAHRLGIPGKENRTTRLELVICAYSSCDSKALGALLFAVGLDALDHHTTPGVHGVLAGSGPVLSNGNPLFEHLYLTSPGYFSSGFDLCEELSPPVEIIQIIPISSGERDLIAKEGWSAFEDAIVEQNIDLMEFDARKEVVSQSNGTASH